MEREREREREKKKRERNLVNFAASGFLDEGLAVQHVSVSC